MTLDWASKYTGAIVRIAGLLHLADNFRDGWGKPVTAQTIDRAQQLGRYFAAHALAAFGDMGTNPAYRLAGTVLAWIRQHPKPAFTHRELYRSVRSQVNAAADLDPVLELLELHSVIRRQERVTGRRGRPSLVFDINPRLRVMPAEVQSLRSATGRVSASQLRRQETFVQMIQ